MDNNKYEVPKNVDYSPKWVISDDTWIPDVDFCDAILIEGVNVDITATVKNRRSKKSTHTCALGQFPKSKNTEFQFTGLDSAHSRTIKFIIDGNNKKDVLCDTSFMINITYITA